MATLSQNWETLNTMLGEDMTFNKPTSRSDTDLPVIKLTFNGSECLADGVRYAINNFQKVAEFEYNNNDGQPIECTLKHLKMGKKYIESDFTKILPKETYHVGLNSLSDTSIGNFILDCHVSALERVKVFDIYTDAKRMDLITTLFGSDYVKAEVKKSEVKLGGSKIMYDCVQIILEMSDIDSAIDTLQINRADRTLAPWRITSVYVQESLKDEFCLALTTDRWNSINNINKTSCQLQAPPINTVKRYSSLYTESKNGEIPLVFDTPPKYLRDLDNAPVTINFFRTANELIQLINNDEIEQTRLASVWTENISLMYELVSKLNVSLIWGNSIGFFDEHIPSLNPIYDLLMEENKRFVNNLQHKMCNLKLFYLIPIFYSSFAILGGKNAVHCFKDLKKGDFWKYLILSYGHTFAN